MQQPGLEVIKGTVSSSSEVQQVAISLVGKVDILFSPIDNTIASAMAIVGKIARDAGSLLCGCRQYGKRRLWPHMALTMLSSVRKQVKWQCR